MDDFLPHEMAWTASAHFYEGDGEWIKREHLYCHNKRTRTSGMHPAVELALSALECPGMLTYISALTGVKGLHADPMRYGGGQHVTTRGGRLGIHADFTHHPQTQMRRALNLLLYLSDGGPSSALQLWSADMKACRVAIAPKFNRAVIFKTGVTSFHGHPEPLEESERLSLAVYYYVQPRVSQMIQTFGNNATAYSWISAPTTVRMDPYLKTTDYRPRPWEYGLRLRKWLSNKVKGNG